MGNAIIAAAGGRTRVDVTPPESAVQSSATGQALRNGAQSIDAMTEHGSAIAAPRIRMVCTSTGEERFEVSNPGRVLEAEDAPAIISHFWLNYGLPLDRGKVVGFANEYMSLAVECGIHPNAFGKTVQHPRCRDSESFAFIVLDKSQECHLGENPNRHARIAYAESCIAPALEKFAILTPDVPLSAHSYIVAAGKFAGLSDDLTDEELKRWKANAMIELLDDILAYHIPVLCESRRLSHLVLAAKAAAVGAPYVQRMKAERAVHDWTVGRDHPRFVELELEIKRNIPRKLKIDTLLRKLFKHAASALRADDEVRLVQCMECIQGLEELSPENVKALLERIQERVADQASDQARVRREYLEGWFKDHGLVTAGVDTFALKPTGESGAQYDSFEHALKLIEFAAAWAFDPHGPFDRALAILGYVSAQAIKQGTTTAGHMKELRSACNEMADQLASSPLEEHNDRALKIDAFLAEGHFAIGE
jgi:hypothetical protein